MSVAAKARDTERETEKEKEKERNREREKERGEKPEDFLPIRTIMSENIRAVWVLILSYFYSNPILIFADRVLLVEPRVWVFRTVLTCGDTLVLIGPRVCGAGEGGKGALAACGVGGGGCRVVSGRTFVVCHF